MISTLHFLRPYWFLALIPLVFLAIFLLQRKPGLQAWSAVCDRHLLDHLIHSKRADKRAFSLWVLFVSAFFLILALAGPTWSRYPVPTFKQVQPRVIVLDMSNSMLTNDIAPSRLSRAKYKLHDLLKMKDAGLFGLVVYTSEPFIVSPLTEDAQTIESLLPTLSPDMMPVQGQNMASGIEQAAQLITQAGYQRGDILILTGTAPTAKAVNEAKAVAQTGIHISILPISKSLPSNPMFKRLASVGRGKMIPFENTSADLKLWLKETGNQQRLEARLKNDIPVWKDEGRWFLIPALVLLLPVFRRGWLQRLVV